MALRERGPTAINGRRPRSGRVSDRTDPEIRCGDHIPNSMGIALWLRWLWLQHADASCPWSSLPIKEDKLTTTFFKESTECFIGNGRSTYFWTDPWIQGPLVEFLAPDLFACLMCRNWWRSTVVDALVGNSWLIDIRGPLTVS
jgi:hypothetical protein